MTDPFARIEPYSRVTYLMDIWSVVDQQRDEASADSTVRVRAYAKVAGRDDLTLSKIEWSFGADEVSSRPGSAKKLSVQDLILREVMRQGWGDGKLERGEPLDNSFALHAARAIRPDMTREEVKAVLEEKAEMFTIGHAAPLGYVSYCVHNCLEKDPESIEWQYEPPTDDPAPKDEGGVVAE